MYIVYETTNTINGKYYIGVHHINGRNYLGSGTALNNAIKKYGKKNFIRETLKKFDFEQDAYNYEELIVNNKMVNNKNCYNLTKGGIKPFNHTGMKRTKETRKKQSLKRIGIKFTKEHCKNISSAVRKRDYNGKNHPMYGRKHKPDSIEKMKGPRPNTVGKNNHKSKLWFIYGKLFYTAEEAGAFFDVGYTSIHRWCNPKSRYHLPLCYSLSN